MLAPADDIAKALGRLGIRRGDTVIIYDDRLRDATLMAVALERVGHKSFAVLHGGYPQWVKEGRPVTSEVPAVESVRYKARGRDRSTVDTDDVYKAVKKGKATVLDVRPAAYFTGEKSDEARPGHIPGAVNRPYEADVAPDSAAWIDEPTLRDAYGGLGVEAGQPVIVHCRTGHQASQTYCLLKHILGYKDVKWFDASWMTWAARDDLPAEVGR
jgi:thiosulfate/3-mercaptopyruvate sulfurtransferase